MKPTMKLGTRCQFCRGILWPWQRVGWRVIRPGVTRFWHPRCLRAAQDAMEQDYAEWRKAR